MYLVDPLRLQALDLDGVNFSFGSFKYIFSVLLLTPFSRFNKVLDFADNRALLFTINICNVEDFNNVIACISLMIDTQL